MTTERRFQRIEQVLTAMAEAQVKTETTLDKVVVSIAAHDNQIHQLVEISERNQRNWEQLQREWQAYLSRIPKQ
jgi:hypothetical protein